MNIFIEVFLLTLLTLLIKFQFKKDNRHSFIMLLPLKIVYIHYYLSLSVLLSIDLKINLKGEIDIVFKTVKLGNQNSRTFLVKRNECTRFLCKCKLPETSVLGNRWLPSPINIHEYFYFRMPSPGKCHASACMAIKRSSEELYLYMCCNRN